MTLSTQCPVSLLREACSGPSLSPAAYPTPGSPPRLPPPPSTTQRPSGPASGQLAGLCVSLCFTREAGFAWCSLPARVAWHPSVLRKTVPGGEKKEKPCGSACCPCSH